MGRAAPARRARSRPGHLELPIDTTLSLLALHGECSGVGIEGVRWPLEGAALAPLIGHGVSNVTTEPTVAVRVSTGVLTIVIAGVLAEHEVAA